MSWLEGFRKTRERFAGALRGVLGSARPDEATLEELADLLIMADVPLRLVDEISRELRQTASARETPRDALRRLLLKAIGPASDFAWPALPSPAVILLVGINGSGKTTTAARLAHAAQQAGRKPLLGAADTYRAAGASQLGIWAERIGCQAVIGATGADAASVAFDAVDAALARRCDVVIIDTAGRMHTREPLMRELQKVRSAIAKRLPEAPHHTWAVLDGTLGQNALLQARQFHQMTPLTGIIVTKLDGSSKGGFLFAIRQELDLPIHFIGLGEQQADLVPFDPAQYVDAMLNTGNSS